MSYPLNEYIDQVVVLVSEDSQTLDNYLVGELIHTWEDGYAVLRYPVIVKPRGTDEDGHTQWTTNPLGVTEELTVHLAHYLGMGPFKEPHASVYRKWRDNYEKHAEIFGEDDSQDSDSGSDLSRDNPASGKDVSASE